jgi:hypothetical protein
MHTSGLMRGMAKDRDVLGGLDALESGEPLNFSLREAAQLAHVSVDLLRREARLGNVRSVKIGHRILIPRAEVLRLVGWEAEAG